MSNENVEKKMVLLVDDDASVRETMAILLHHQGYSVLQAENGAEALAILDKTNHFPCLVVLDLAMPVMDGRGF